MGPEINPKSYTHDINKESQANWKLIISSERQCIALNRDEGHITYLVSEVKRMIYIFVDTNIRNDFKAFIYHIPFTLTRNMIILW